MSVYIWQKVERTVTNPRTVHVNKTLLIDLKEIDNTVGLRHCLCFCVSSCWSFFGNRTVRKGSNTSMMGLTTFLAQLFTFNRATGSSTKFSYQIPSRLPSCSKSKYIVDKALRMSHIDESFSFLRHLFSRTQTSNRTKIHALLFQILILFKRKSHPLFYD